MVSAAAENTAGQHCNFVWTMQSEARREWNGQRETAMSSAILATLIAIACVIAAIYIPPPHRGYLERDDS